tara:strand:+ start:407 stop:781 length:375 start_codon:yes stop_codon:yes gene_type:complete
MNFLLYYLCILITSATGFLPKFPTKYSLRKYELYISELEQKIKHLETQTFPSRPLYYGIYTSRGVNTSLIEDNWCYTNSFPKIPTHWVCMGQTTTKKGNQELWMDPNNNTKYIHIVRNPFINGY